MQSRVPDYKNAEYQAKLLLEKLSITEAPVNIEDLIESHGLSVAAAEFNNQSVSGFINLEQRIILVNKFDPYTRQRFTIAHELGHWILHKEEIRNNKNIVIVYRKNLDEEQDPLEKEANCFAANILVPKSLLENYLKDPISDDVLAKKFLVSISVIRFRRGFLNGA